jgi:hypothetical protein
MRAPLGPQYDQAADDECNGDGHGLEERRLDVFTEQQAEHCGGHERDREIQHELLRFAVAGDAAQQAGKFDAVFPHDRQHGAGLDHEFEYLAFLVVETEQLPDDDQMPRARHRQKLGETLDGAEYDDLDPQHEVHRVIVSSIARLSRRAMQRNW